MISPAAAIILSLCLLPMEAGAAIGAPNLDLLKMRDKIAGDAQQRIQTEILDRVLGHGQASVFVDLQISLTARLKENIKGGAGKTEEYKTKGPKKGQIPTEFVLPGVPRPQSVTADKKEEPKPEAAQGRTAELSKIEQEELFRQDMKINDFKATIIHDENVTPDKIKELRTLIVEAMAPYELRSENIFFRAAKYHQEYKSKDWKTKLIDDLRQPSTFIPLLYALLTMLLLLFLFGPLWGFFRRYTRAMVEKPAAEINVESNILPPEEEKDGGGGGGGGGGEEDGKLDIMIGRKPPEPPPDPDSDEEDDMAKMEPFSYISEDNLKRLANLFLLRREEPWLVAVVLSYLQPEFARQVLAALPVEFQTKVAMEALKVRQVTREQIRAIDEDIKENVEFVVGGIERLTRMLEESDSVTRANILESLKNEKPVVYEHVRRSILLFEDFAGFPDREMQAVVRELNTENMARALQGCAPEVVNKFFANMSTNAASLLKESMEYMKDLTPAQIEDERSKILDTVKTLEKEGKITLRTGADDLGSYQEVLAGDGERGMKISQREDKAVAAPAPTLESNPEEAKRYFDAGLSSYEKGEKDNALEYFRQAVEFDSQSWEAMQYCGTILSEMGRTSEALVYYEKVLAQHPDPDLQAWVDSQKAQT